MVKNLPVCNAGDPGSVPGLGRSPREGTSNPLQYSWGFPGGSDGKKKKKEKEKKNSKEIMKVN